MQQENRGQSTSLWMATTAVPNQSTLGEDIHADVCIVGAGIAGITTAYLLAKQGKSVIVLDDGAIGGGQTQRTTAHLSNALDDRYLEIERLHGSEGAKLAAASHTAAIDRIESIVGDEQIACDFVRLDGYLFVPLGESPELLDRELAAAHRAGLSGVERLPRAPLLPFETGPCLRFPRQAQFDPLKYLTAIAGALQRAGGRIFTGTHAETIQGGKPARVKTAAGRTVTAEAVVVATNSPVNDLLAIHTKQAAYMTYAIGAIVPRGAVPTALYWDTLEPYHYVRIQPLSPEAGLAEPSGSGGQDVLIVGGEDHKTGQAEVQTDPYARLESWTRLRFPMIREVKFRWSGQVLETIDGLAFIGRNPLDEPNVFIVTGDSGMGMTHGTIAGILLTDLILGRENPWAKLYDPSRKTLHALDRFVNENLNVAMQYGDWLTGGDVDSPGQIKPGAGAVIRRGLTKMALYRDEQGALHERSAVCPHLGGIVHWNDAEKTWDCPCHGSRFDRLGGVLNGPANRDLGGVDIPASNIISLRYTDAGRGLPLVFLHGFPLSRGVWQKQIEGFRESYRVIAPDLRGLGDSETQPGPATMAQCAADLRALLEQLATGPMVLIGHSMGGYVALAFARQFPEKLRGLVLVSTKAGPDTAEAAAGRRAMAEKVKAEGVQVVVDAMAPKMLAAGNQDAEMVAQVLGFMAPSRPAGVIGALLGMAERPDATAFLTQIAVPTLVITGADDALIPPAESETLAQAIRARS